MDKVYNPHQIEQQWYKFWEKNGLFSPEGSGSSYCIMLPPPNVTGSLHMGHGFQGTLMDILIRYHRMLGDKVLWQGGTDHAGIATQMVVERLLQKENKNRHDLGRDAFIKRVWEWKKESGGKITEQFRRLGASLDWQREQFTLNENLSVAVREAFIRLYQEGLIYRGKRLVNWDPVLLTAISDLEVINQEEEGKLVYIRYPLVETTGYMVVATTRPETLFGDVAVAVHPEDERYQSLIGKRVRLPLTDKTIPIIADDYVDPSFGTGCLKITPAHDFNDYKVGLKHQLEPINIFTPDAHLNENVPKEYQGLERTQARKQAMLNLETENCIEKTEKHILKVPRGDRSNAVIEPYLTYQWFLKMEPLAKPAIKAVKDGTIRFIPENWDKTYFQWMNNIEDWCISRQLWWGHQIPIWYDEEGNSYAGHSVDSIRKEYKLPETLKLKQDEDVLDTWFSSALWPFSTLGWPEETQALKQFFPTQVLVTGFDIIFFWVARMMMMSLKFTGKIPFSDIYITGLIRDAEGQKMSKTKGNVLDPIDLIDGITLEALTQKRTHGLMQPAMAKKIEQTTRQHFPKGIPSYGTDALRMTFSSLASHTREIRFDLNRLEGYRNFCNKLWNATRFVLMNVESHELLSTDFKNLSLPDRWIRSQLQKLVQETHEHLSNYRFDLLTQALYDFTWNTFCDWYLEIAKINLNSENPSATEKSGIRFNLLFILEKLLLMLHPIIPFITEEIWQKISSLLPKNTAKPKSIMLCRYPSLNKDEIDNGAENEMLWVQTLTMNIRVMRSQANIPPTQKLPLFVIHGSDEDQVYLEKYNSLIKNLAKLSDIQRISQHEKPKSSASTLLGQLEIFIPLEGIIDVEKEVVKIKKEIQKLQNDILVTENKLNNQNFIERAPADIVDKERMRLTEIKNTLQQLDEQLKRLLKS